MGLGVEGEQLAGGLGVPLSEGLGEEDEAVVQVVETGEGWETATSSKPAGVCELYSGSRWLLRFRRRPVALPTDPFPGEPPPASV